MEGGRFRSRPLNRSRKPGRLMLETGCLVKKRGEIETMLQYFQGIITGTEVGAFFNNEVRIGKRTGKIRKFDVPFTYPQGKSESLRGLSHRRTCLSNAQRESISRTYSIKGRTMYQLASMYHVSPSTICRVVRGLRRGSTQDDESQNYR